MYVSVVFFIKLGLVLGGVIVGWLLVFYGYEVNVEFSEIILLGILILFIFYLVIGSMFVVFIMKMYIFDN